jgi:mycothiol synthase
VDGELVGYVRGWWWKDAGGSVLHGQVAFVAPQWRRRGIGAAMQEWIERRQREIAATMPGPAHLHHVFVMGEEVGRAALLRGAGYQRVREFLLMLRATLDDIAEVPLPAGFELRPVAPEHHRAIWDTHLEALRDHWGMAATTEEDYQRWLKAPTFQPQLWQVAWDVASGEVAGQVKPYIDQEQNALFGRKRGWTEFISVDARWRRRGLARALVMRALRAQRDAGMTESALGVDADNGYGAARLYEACGFRVVKRNAVLRKPVAPARSALG